uniref:Uncharacterized protein n=1 Tax=Ditylum brightwellii TaxID=49249 RepID=A0A7S1YWX4_9STRA|mmetsp:Transcript_19367/g.28913  ORF Transcript_19367/g.28913 Transcript_19367/m.28913 type:complete len:100 (+) Transcript_19367:56-355(+)
MIKIEPIREAGLRIVALFLVEDKDYIDRHVQVFVHPVKQKIRCNVLNTPGDNLLTPSNKQTTPLIAACTNDECPQYASPVVALAFRFYDISREETSWHQ